MYHNPFSRTLREMRGARYYAVLLIALLALAVMPGLVEAGENVYHLVIHGDLAHSSEPGHTPFNQEHGCSTGCHLCSCCHSQILDYTAKVMISEPLIPASSSSGYGPAPVVSGFLSTPKEPPRV